MGRQINLETCTKNQLIARIEYMRKNAKDNLFIHLEDKYCENPRLLFDKNEKTSYVGQIMIIDRNYPKLNKLINACWKDEFYEDTVESFVNDLYDNYILGVYQ